MGQRGSGSFLTLDGALDLAQAHALARRVDPEFLVVRAEGADGAPPRFFVVRTDELLAIGDLEQASTIGELFARRFRPATVVESGGSPTVNAGGVAVVLDDDGIVWRVVHKAGLETVVEDVGGGLEALGAVEQPPERMALEVQFPDAAKLGDTVPILVLLRGGSGAPGSAPLDVRAGEVLEIMVSPVSGFTLVDKPAKPMTIVLQGETLPVKFDLRADVEGRGVAKVYAFRDGTCVASLTVSAAISASDVVAGPVVPAALQLAARPAAVADLDLIVLKESFQGGLALRYRLTDGKRRVTTDFGPRPLDSDPSEYVHSTFAEIEALARQSGAWDGARRLRLEAIGAGLYEALVPEDLQRVLWDTDRVGSVLVQTEEPWIPWELCRMTVQRNGRTEARGFLCELYDMTRWLPGVEHKPELRATRLGVVAPRDSGLPSAPGEVDMVMALGASGPTVERVKATYEAVVGALASHRYDLLHFVGHGQNVDPDNATRSEFVLSGRWRLTPSDISGETRNLGLAFPLVFMNACQVAQASMALHGIGGWAAAMTRAGAGAFIGTHWDVRDDLAHEFATTLYRELSGGRTVAAAAREARRVVRERPDSDATWLAYSVHASPGATCTFSAPVP